jgi:hypothetical protein
MNTQRVIAVLMLFIQLLLFAVVHQTYFYVTVIAILVLIGYPGKFTVVIKNSRQTIYGGILGLIFFAKWAYFPTPVLGVHGFLQNLGLPLTQYFLTLQIFTFYIRRYKRMPSIFPMFGVGSLVCLGDLSPSAFQLMYYQVTIVLFIALTAIYFNAARNKRYPKSVHMKRLLAPSLVLFIALGLSSITSVFLYKYRNDIDALYTNFAYANLPDMQGVGLSPTASLGSVASRKMDGGKAVALRIYSDKEPGYMRGRVFDEYANRVWDSGLPNNSLPPRPLLNSPGKNRFMIRGLASLEFEEESDKTMEIWPSGNLRGIGFNQLYTSHIDIRAEVVHSTEFGAVTSGEFKGGLPYTLHYNYDRRLPAPTTNAANLSLFVSDSTDQEVLDLAESLFVGAVTPEEKAARVISYFQENYTYDLGVQVPSDVNPLTWFLTEKPPAHCEYFATGSAILLRLGGVPTRYVTGYLAGEKNSAGGYYVARSRDAHAWTEAWISGQWVLIEATPAEGIPHPEPIKESTQYWNDLKHRMTKIKHALLAGKFVDSLQELAIGLRAFLLAIILNKFTYIWLAAIGFLASIGFQIRKNSRPVPSDPYQELHMFLQELDEKVKDKGITRDTSETIHQFAQRIDSSAEDDLFLKQAASWYRQYAVRRYLPRKERKVSTEGLPPIPKEIIP